LTNITNFFITRLDNYPASGTKNQNENESESDLIVVGVYTDHLTEDKKGDDAS
jgi:hypothetical protein